MIASIQSWSRSRCVDLFLSTDLQKDCLSAYVVVQLLTMTKIPMTSIDLFYSTDLQKNCRKFQISSHSRCIVDTAFFDWLNKRLYIDERCRRIVHDDDNLNDFDIPLHSTELQADCLSTYFVVELSTTNWMTIDRLTKKLPINVRHQQFDRELKSFPMYRR